MMFIMKKYDLIIYKRTLLLMMMAFTFCLYVNAKKKPKPILKSKIEVISKRSEKGTLLKFYAEAYDWDNTWIKYFYIENGTDERIYIEWENARVTNSRVVFGDDRRISMGNPKADEAVSVHNRSIMRDITGETYIGRRTLLPLYEPEQLKKNIGQSDTTYLLIPIRYSDGTVEDFKLAFTVWYEMPIDEQL